MYRILVFSFLLFLLVNLSAQNWIDTSRRDMSVEEIKLYELIMEYRSEKKLAPILLSEELSYVALMHARDLNENIPSGRCNMHSWSPHGPWEKCCYTDDHRKSQCMWDKPRELTNYKGNGYEIAFWSTDTLNMAEEALYSWKISKSHNSVIVNSGVWGSHPWESVGIAIVGSFAVVWFGEE